jgi:formylmethanofuran dehydrogenase subunit E
MKKIILALAFLCAAVSAYAETPDEWIAFGTRVHGFFGGFIPAGIRIGLDAMQRLHAQPRELTVTYYQGTKAPCPCVVDGIALAVGASLGQGTATVASEKAPAGLMGVAVIRNRKTGEGLRYEIGDDWLPKMLAWNKEEPRKRFDDAMQAPDMFTIESLSKP